jgi:hypothetical protein
MAIAGQVPGDPDHVLVGVVPDDPDPNPTLAVWIGYDDVTQITLEDAERLAWILTKAVKTARREVA